MPWRVSKAASPVVMLWVSRPQDCQNSSPQNSRTMSVRWPGDEESSSAPAGAVANVRGSGSVRMPKAASERSRR